MNTREREVMDALAKELRCSVDAQTSAALAAYDCLMTDEHDALLAEGSARSEGAEAVGYVTEGALRQLREGASLVNLWRAAGTDDDVPLYTHQQPAQGEHEQRSCEGSERSRCAECHTEPGACTCERGSERRPIADEDRAVCDFIFDFNNRFGSVVIGGPHVHAMRDALRARESALPRGLPAGSDAKEDSR
jgi:hypothetical protein